LLAGSFLKGQGDQAAETSLRQRVLVRKETVVGIQPDVGPAFHRLGQEMRAKPPRQRGGNGVLEEEPHVTAASRPRPFELGGHTQPTARLEERRSIVGPAALVEVESHEEAGLVQKERVDARDEGLAVVTLPGQVPTDDLVGHREESAVRAFGALDAGLRADAAHPLVRAGGRIPGFGGLLALESTRVHIVAPAEERPEETDFRR
jgi:hypothetical protein